MDKKDFKMLMYALYGNKQLIIPDGQTLQQWIDNAFIEKKKEAINYTHCCEELKELDDDNFWHWLIVNGYTVYKDHYMKGDQVFFESELIQKYNNEVMDF